MKKTIYYDTSDVLITVLIQNSLEIISNYSQIIDEHILTEIVIEKITQLVKDLIDWNTIGTTSDDPNDLITSNSLN